MNGIYRMGRAGKLGDRMNEGGAMRKLNR